MLLALTRNAHHAQSLQAVSVESRLNGTNAWQAKQLCLTALTNAYNKVRFLAIYGMTSVHCTLSYVLCTCHMHHMFFQRCIGT